MGTWLAHHQESDCEALDSQRGDNDSQNRDRTNWVKLPEQSSVAPVSSHVAIVTAACELGCALIVMPSQGRRGIEGLRLGSENHKVIVER